MRAPSLIALLPGSRPLQATEALQRANMPFELMIYRQKSHGVMGRDRNHLNQLMTSFFERALGAK